MKNIYWLIAGCILLGIIALTTPAPRPTPPREASSTPPVAQEPVAKIFTLAQVATHDSLSSCYTIVGGQVFDLTSWVSKHPGGEKAILGLCGEDGTEDFTEQHGSSEKAQKVLRSFFIGVIK